VRPAAALITAPRWGRTTVVRSRIGPSGVVVIGDNPLSPVGQARPLRTAADWDRSLRCEVAELRGARSRQSGAEVW